MPGRGYLGTTYLDLARYPPCLDLVGFPPDLVWGYPSLAGEYPGTPLVWTWLGGTHPWWGYPSLVGCTPHLDLARYPPSLVWTWLGGTHPWQGGTWVSPSGPGQVPPLPPQVWTDRRMDGWTGTCQSTTFPRTTYAVGN